MSIRERIPDEALDKTHEEIREMEEFPDEQLATEEEFREHVGDIHEAIEIYMGSIIINRMFDDNYLTLDEYLELMDYVQEYESDLDATLM